VSVQVFLGWLTGRWGAERVMFVCLAIWSLATIALGFATGIATLIACRLLLGVGEAAAFPCLSAILARDIPKERLGVANGIVTFGYTFGPAAGTYLGALVAARYGWRMLFISFGLLSCLWLLPWGLVARRPRVTVPAPAATAALKERAAGVGLPVLLNSPAVWGTALGLFASNYAWYFMLAWLPSYLMRERGFSLEDMGLVAGLGYLITALSAFAMGWWSDRHVAKGGSATFIYKAPLVVFHVVAVGSTLAMAYGSMTVALAGLFLYQVLNGACSPAIYATSQIMAGPDNAGRWVGIQNSVGNLPSIIAPIVTGILLGQSGHFTTALLAVAAVNLLGLYAWLGLVPRIAPLELRTARP
jgi:MFS family permease